MASTAHQEKKWVIVFLIYADFRTDNTFSMDIPTKTELNILLQDIMTCPLNDRASLYVVMDSIQYVTQTGSSGYVIDERLLVYEVKASPGLPLNTFGEVKPIEHSTASVQDPARLGHPLQREEKLTKVLKNITPAENEEVFLITWDHGSAFGMFRQVDPKVLYPRVQMPLTHQLENFPYVQLFWNRAMQEEKFSAFMELKSKQLPALDLKAGYELYHIRPGDDNYLPVISWKEQQVHDLKLDVGALKPPAILKNGELAQALKEWLGKRENKKVGVLLMMNCWMMNLHTMYSLRDCVKYLVAPQGYIDTPGYNYHDILLSVYNSSPLPLEPQALASNVVNLSCNDFFFERARVINTNCPDTIRYRTIITVQLGYPDAWSPFDDLIRKLQAISTILIAYLEADTATTGIHDLLSFVRALSFDFTEYWAYMIDLPNYLQCLVSAISLVQPGLVSPEFESTIGHLLYDVLSQPPVIPPKFIGSKCYYYADAGKQRWQLTGMDPTGFSIFFPTSAIKYCPDPNLMDNVKDDELMNGPLQDWKKLVNLLFDNIIP